MMKILWFANTPCGATERLTGKPVLGGGWLYSLSEELKNRKDVELHIAFYWGHTVEPFNYKGIIYHPVLQEGEGSKLGRLINRFIVASSNMIDLKMLPRLMDVVSDVKPDLIHIHGSENNYGIIASQLLPCPIVMSIQGLLSLSIYIYYRGYTKQEISRNEGLMQKLLMSGISMKEKSFRRRGAMEREFFKNIPNIIGRTFWDKAGSLAMNPARRYFEVGEIMRPEFFNAYWGKKEFSKPYVITTTISAGYYKGLETVFHASKILKNARFDYKWQVIGIGEKDLLTNLSEKQVACKAEELNIHLLGRKNAQEMVALMTDADLFVQVSHIENSPNSLGEAMLLGMPIIATFAGGTASMLENNVEGWLLQDGEPYSMAGMIMEMASDFERAKAFGEHARQTALARHNPKHVCEQLLTAYHTILSE